MSRTESGIALVHSELINPNGHNSEQILSPSYIPVHPLVSAQAHLFSREHLNDVINALNGYVQDDLETLAKFFGERYKFEEIKTEDLQGYFWSDYDTEKMRIDFGQLGSNIGLGDNDRLLTSSKEIPLMPVDKLQGYSKSTDSLAVQTWYTHTVWDNGLDTFLYLRNFAIAFNNIGLEKLAIR